MTAPHSALLVQHLSQLALALSTETSHTLLLEKIMDGCIALSNSDAGTLYTLDEKDANLLNFNVVRNRTLGLNSAELPAIALKNPAGEAAKLVVVQTFLQQQTINIPDAYNCQQYDFSGTVRFDNQFNYRSTSFLCVPLKDHEGQIIGVLQLINALNTQGQPVPFSPETQLIIESLSSLAASALTKRKLIDTQRELLEAFIKMIGRAIDHKSPVTGKHCEHVPAIAQVLAEAVCDSHEGPFASTEFSDEQLYELKISAWLHDCGKLTTPEHIIDKGTKLEAMIDRIELVRSRFGLYRQHLEIQHLSGTLETAHYQHQVTEALNNLEFLEQVNRGGEFLSDEAVERIDAIARVEWFDSFGDLHRLLLPDEIMNLQIRRGTLNARERTIMQDHIIVTQEMLNALPYPRQLAAVPEIAGNHHECINGSGYPRGLTGEQMSLQARIMCIADIFEALTAPDRPYKKGMMLSQALTIMGRMVEEGKLDRDLFNLFVSSRAYRRYADQYMVAKQIDEPDLSRLPGLYPLTQQPAVEPA